MQSIWAAIGQFEQSHTSIITTLMLIVGGGLGVFLGSFLFGGRVKDLKSALKESQEIIEAHKEASSKQLQDINIQLS